MHSRFFRKRVLALLLLITTTISFAQTYKYEPYRSEVTPTKNVIVMIPDGTSMGVVSSARLYKSYNGLGASLNIDPYLCGSVITFSSNAPIGDSAPTTSCYMTGMPQQTGNVSLYPVADAVNDLVVVDPEMAYQPLATILEAARIEKGKAVGLVVTCEFPHATPADCAAQYPRRSDYAAIASQMAYQNLDIMFGGGVSFVSEDMKAHFADKGIAYIENDLTAFRRLSQGRAWALFEARDLPYELDRNPDKTPSLEEMTKKALDILSMHENGFFLMVEGSKVDWAAHANDAVGAITEFIAFDNAVGAAIDFAKKEGNTTVIILPDHGNSGFTLGRRDLRGYDSATINQLFGTVSKYKKTAEGLEKILLEVKPDDIKATVKQYTEIEITEEEYLKLLNARNYPAEGYTKTEVTQDMQATLVEIMNQRTYFGFTTGGHTGEEVFLAAYHPRHNIPFGVNTNIEINHYLQDILGLQTKLPELTRSIFAKHTEIFKGYQITIDKSNSEQHPVLVVVSGGKKLEIPAFKSVAYLNGEPLEVGSVVVYISDNETFYLPAALSELMR